MKIFTSALKQWVNDRLDSKVDKEAGKKLSTNDYTNEDKRKLSNVEKTLTTTISRINQLPEHTWESLPDKPFGYEDIRNYIVNWNSLELSKSDEADGMFIYKTMHPKWYQIHNLIEGETYRVEAYWGATFGVGYVDDDGYVSFTYYDYGINAHVTITDSIDDLWEVKIELSHDAGDTLSYTMYDVYCDERQYYTLDENYIPDSIARKSDLESANSTVDWNNIQNRPFYEENTGYSVIPYTYGISVTDDGNGTYVATVTPENYIPLELGVVYNVTFDGYGYNVYAESDEFGNKYLRFDYQFNDMYPVTIIDNYSGNFDIKIENLDFSVSEIYIIIDALNSYIQQIDEKFIPDSIARKSDLENLGEGSSTVDWNDIQNKPFYENTNFYEIVPYTNITLYFPVSCPMPF